MTIINFCEIFLRIIYDWFWIMITLESRTKYDCDNKIYSLWFILQKLNYHKKISKYIKWNQSVIGFNTKVIKKVNFYDNYIYM